MRNSNTNTIKNFLSPLLLFMTFIVNTSCSKESDNSYTFRNDTEYKVTVSPDEIIDAPFFKINLAPGETKTYESDNNYALFTVESQESERNFFYKLQGDTRVIFSYKYYLKYVITGNAENADLTIGTPNGGTSQFEVQVPATLGYEDFYDNFFYVSAQNNGASGNLTVEIYRYDTEKLATDYCGGAYCIATASYLN